MSFCVPESLFWTITLFILGLALICLSGDKFVDAAVAIATRLRIPQIVVGATIVSLGTTLPEILVSTTAAFSGMAAISVGNALGSIICNTALIAGLGQVLAPAKRVERASVTWRLVYFYVAAAAFLLLGILLGALPRFYGILALLAFALYAYLSIKKADRSQLAEDVDLTNVPPVWRSLVVLVVCAAVLFVGANLLIDNGQVLALDYLHVPERVVAVTMIALGTSLPELVTTLTSVAKKQGDVGLGNIIGANLFNLLLVMGIPSAIGGRIALTQQSVYIDTPLAVGVMSLLILPMLVKKKGSRIIGLLLLLIYIGYCVYSFLAG